MFGIWGRLFVSYLLVIFITLATVHLATAYLFADYYFAAKEKEMFREAENLADALTEISPDPTPRRGNERLILLDRRQIETGPFGRGTGRRPWLGTEEASRLLAGEPVSTRWFHPRLEQEVLLVAAPIIHQQEDRVTGAVLLFAPITDLDATVAAVRRITLTAAGVAVLLAAALGFRLSRSFSGPLREMSRISVDMARGNFGRRIAVTRRDEIGQLAENLNRLAGSLDHSVGELAREKEKLESVIVNMVEGVLAVDAAGQMILANAPARKALQLKTKEDSHVESQPIPVPELAVLFHKVVATGDQQTAELELNETNLLVQCSPLCHRSGTVFGAVAVLQDITALRKLEQMRRGFVADVSHELRTPLTTIQSIIEGLIDGVISETEAREYYLQAAHRETRRMTQMIQDLLDLAALEAGHPDWELHAIETGEALNRVEARLQTRLTEKNLTVRPALPENLPPLLANENRLEQVLTNLIENALRFSPSGGEITVTAAEQPGNKITVTIRDQGPGIPPADLPHIWDRFYRVEKSRTRDSGGTGLGLAIVKQIIEAQGGTVGVESTPGQGTCFHFTLPAARLG